MKIGNINFRDSNVCKDITYEVFESLYKNELKGVSLKYAYKQLGGTIEDKDSKKSNKSK